MIVFVGDKPSVHNIDPKVAFVGTKSYKTLLSWIADMDVDIQQVRLDNASTFKAWNYMEEGYKFVALGNEAAIKLKACGFKYFQLPHPSGMNRKLNDKAWLLSQLFECKNYIFR